MSVYSYHTFILPFVWEGTLEHRKTMDEFSECFRGNPNWVCTDMPNEYYIQESPALEKREDVLLLYKEYQYFHPFVRKAIYGYGENIVTNYSFMPEKIRNNGHYYITKNGTTYDLTLNGIKLKIFNTGIALFIMECENRGIDADRNRQDDFESVKNINDYGRRISLPYIPKTDDLQFFICADRLCVELEGEFSFEDDYKGYIERINSEENLYANLSLTHMCDFIKKILSYGSFNQFTSRRRDEGEKFFIYPALDDRMFVASYVIDKPSSDKISSTLKTVDMEKENINNDDNESLKSLYEFIFVDSSRNCTCQDRKMRNQLIGEHIYRRWLDYGTVTTTACQAMNTLTGSSLSHLIDTFLTQYIQMVCLCLVQRATLIHFQREASMLSADIEKSGRSIDRATILRLMNLQERFVAYKSQLYFTEVTPQEQGIEIYDMLHDVMLIEKENESLSGHLESLQEAADTNLDFGFNKLAVIFTVVSFFLAFMDFLTNFFNGLEYMDCINAGKSILSLTVVVSLAMLLIISYSYRRRD